MIVFSSQDKLQIASPEAVQDDEAAAIVAAVRSYMLSESAPPEKKAAAPSPWALSNRGYAAQRKGWTSLSLSLLLAICLQSGVQAQSEDLSGTNLALAPASALKSSPQQGGKKVRVLVKEGSRIDLEIPDGASIYSLSDGVKLGTMAACGSFSLSLKGTGQMLALKGKGEFDKFSKAAPVRTVAFSPLPAGGSEMLLPTIKEKQLMPDLTVPSEAMSDSRQAEGFDPSQGYLVVSENGGLIGVGNRFYRGAVLIKLNKRANAPILSAINIVDLEDYLLSVVPSEVPSKWPQEVLKAQAIAARSYAVANLNKHKTEGYDVKDTVDDQVYLGVQSESEETNQAVSATNGLVLKHNQNVISAFFHSTSGGTTELAETVWGKSLPYLKSVVDYDDESPHFNWKREVKADKLSSLFGAAPRSAPLVSDGAPVRKERVVALLVVDRHGGDGRRVKNLLVVGDERIRLLTGSEARRLYNLPSTQFSVFQNGDTYIFSGRGFGHGLGLSQWGAKALADRGYNAGQILSYYYKDVTIESLAPKELNDARALQNGAI
ncbi:MAG: SpoIID/LytB domain-containing protein [Candidatus Obscuribacter sp.]|nr:SpoIID/LytB domain-containing protein [Candidatus Obscuribacter sp.]